jgi:hypothetical protein
MAELKSQGTAVHFITAGSPQVLRELGKVAGFNGLGGSAGEIDITNLKSVRKEFLRGLRDGGTVSMDLNLDTADVGQDDLWLLDAAGTAVQFCISLSDGTNNPTLTGNNLTPPNNRSSFKFTAFVQQMTVNGQSDDAIRISLSLRVTGDILFTQKP